MLQATYRRAIAAIALPLLFLSHPVLAADIDAAAVGKAVGVEAKQQPDGVVRVGWSRNDVVVKVDGLALPPAAGLGSWAAFKSTGDQAMVMGDTVVFEDEVDAAMDAAFASGLEVTGLHNHFFHDTPKVYFMHIGGHGEAAALASGVKAVWDAIKTVRQRDAVPATAFGGATPGIGKLDADAISRAIGHRAEVNGDVVKVTIGREGRMHGTSVGASMGVTTWAAFTGSGKLAAMDGDVVMAASEVQPVLHALRKAGIHVVALHNHMLGEEPAFYFVHFWGKGPAMELAGGVRRMLDAQASTGARSAH
jgi:hypothetical protein